LASSHPDGLEWSIEKITGETELEADSGIYDTAAEIQDKAALLPDYAFKDSDSAWGTTFSGVIGGGIVIVVCVGACYAFKFFRKKKVFMSKIDSAIYEIHTMDMLAVKRPVGESDSSTG